MLGQSHEYKSRREGLAKSAGTVLRRVPLAMLDVCRCLTSSSNVLLRPLSSDHRCMLR